MRKGGMCERGRKMREREIEMNSVCEREGHM